MEFLFDLIFFILFFGLLIMIVIKFLTFLVNTLITLKKINLNLFTYNPKNKMQHHSNEKNKRHLYLVKNNIK